MSQQLAGGKGQPFVTVQILVGNQWKSYKAIMDSGNDLTLITTQTAQQLGLSPRMSTGNFKVQFGENKNQGHDFYMVKTQMKFNNLKPFHASVGVGPVRENLVGRKDVFEHHDIVFSKGQVKMFQSGPGANTIGMQFPQNHTQQFEKQHRGSTYRDVLPGNYV